MAMPQCGTPLVPLLWGAGGAGAAFEKTEFLVHTLTLIKAAALVHKVCKRLTHVVLKSAHANSQKCITWSKKSDKNTKEWNKTCEDFSICPKN
jgi:hypothetical protein